MMAPFFISLFGLFFSVSSVASQDGLVSADCEGSVRPPVSVGQVAEMIGLHSTGREVIRLRARPSKETAKGQPEQFKDTYFLVEVSPSRTGALEIWIEQVKKENQAPVGGVAFIFTNAGSRIIRGVHYGDFEVQTRGQYTPQDSRSLYGFEFVTADLAVMVEANRIRGISLILASDKNDATRTIELNGFREIQEDLEGL